MVLIALLIQWLVLALLGVWVFGWLMRRKLPRQEVDRAARRFALVWLPGVAVLLVAEYLLWD